jgi:hypothetical protein
VNLVLFRWILGIRSVAKSLLKKEAINGSGARY